jgi:O-antigen/teichoic acid export membrane protein
MGRAQVDRAVAFSVLTRVWLLMTAPITLILIGRYFSPEVQGFYYTFSSLLALRSFVELGFFLVIISVASHEWASLELDESGHIVGDPKALARLISLGRLIFKWYAVASAIFVLGVSVIGYFFFFSQGGQANVNWLWPWLVLVVLTGLQLWALPFTSLLEGCNQVTAINQFRLSQAVLGGLALWLSIAFGLGLWAAAIWTGVSLTRDLYLLLVRYGGFFKEFWRPQLGPGINWKLEIWPMQWRLGMSGIVSYLSFSLFNPVIFHYHGASAAGRLGMTLSVVLGLQAVAQSWVHTKVPRFGLLISQKKYDALDRLFFRTSLMSVIIICAGALALWILVYGLYALHHPLGQRLLSPLPTALFLLAFVLFQVSLCLTAYLRAHKQEPIMVLSVTSSVAIGVLVWLLGSSYGSLGAAIGYLAVVALFIVPYEVAIWRRCRSEWHQV